MKCLSVRPPWAWCIVNLPGALAKRVENRTWQTKYRGPLLIHSSGTLTREDWGNACELAREAGASVSDLPTLHQLDAIRGRIIGAARLVEVSHPGWCADGFDENDPWRDPDCFGWHLADRIALPTRPMLGKLGVFEVEPTPVELALLRPAGLAA